MTTLDPFPDSWDRSATAQSSGVMPTPRSAVRSDEHASGLPGRQPIESPPGNDATVGENQDRAVECSHCGLPVPAGLIRPHESRQFCCHGCQTAYQIITGCDLDDFYRLADNKQAVPAREAGDFEEFDSDYFLSRYTRTFGTSPEKGTSAVDSTGPVPDSEEASTAVIAAPVAGGLRQVTFAIDGLHCSACIWLIEKLPQIRPGVVEAIVNWNSQSVTLTVETSTPLSAVARTLADLGYYPTVFESDTQLERARQENRKALFDLGFAGAAAGNNMLVALSLYLGEYYGMAPAIERLLVFYSGLISLASVLGPGRKILSKAVWAIRTRTPHMDLPVALGITVGLVAGWVNIFLGSAAVFFDSISVLIFVLLLGRYIQQIQQRSAIEKISLVNRLLPRFCKRRQAGVVAKVSVEEIQAGDIVVVDRQQTIPVDGTVLVGHSSIDGSILTGESFPVSVGEQSQVFAGTVNLEDTLEVEAAQPAQQSRIATIFQDVEKSVRKKTRIVQFADRIGARFVVAVLVLAAVTFAIWLPDWMFAANAAVAVLIVACPCALALATPVAISVALSAALRQKILIKDGDVFEQLAQCQTIWFDKTGTLTEGQLRVTGWVGDERFQPIVAALEAKSNHPVAQAIVQSLVSSETGEIVTDTSLQVSDYEQHSNGISGRIGEHRYTVGSRGRMEAAGIEINDDFAQQEQQFLENGWSPVLVAEDQQVVAIMSIGDQLRSEASEVVAGLKDRCQVGILSGDRRQIVDQVAARLNIDPQNCYAELTPQQKSAIIADSSRTLMIGDGVNDSSALAAANVGMAINDKLDLNSRIAPVVLRSDQLDQVPRLLAASQRVMRLIYRNIAVSLLYNVLAVSLSMAGYIHPVIAAIFMPVSSLSILFVSLLFNPFSQKEIR